MNSFCDILKAFWEGFVMIIKSTIPEEAISDISAFLSECVTLVRNILDLFIN